MSADTNAQPMEVDAFGQEAIDRHTSHVIEYNALVATIKAASGSPEDVLAAVMSDSSNPSMEKYNSAIEKHKAAIQKLEHDQLVEAQPLADERLKAGSSNVEAETEKADALHKVLRSAKTYLIDSYGEAALENVPEIARRTNRSSGGGGGKRIRGFDVYVNDELATMRDQQGVERSNFAAAAKAAGVVTVDLQKAFFVAAGSEDKDKWPNRVEFTVTDSEGASNTVVAVRLTEEETPAKTA